MSLSKRERPASGIQVNMATEENLNMLAKEVEPVYDPTQQSQLVGYRYTYRAVLARKGYLVRLSLGAGSYSKVKMALHITGGGSSEKVAVKIIDRRRGPNDYLEKFLPRELSVWPTLNHPNLISLEQFFQDSRFIYMISEFAEGGDTLSYIQNNGAVSDTVARKWTLQIVDAVRYMHEKDITHRDLKLENILLDKNGNIKICDFGFVKEHCSQDLSKTYCGSKAYAAPEILVGKPYNPKKSDVWAIGVIVYILVTGKMPYDETKGTKHILDEQQKIAGRFPKLHKVSTQCKELMKRIFTWNFFLRPSIHDLLMEQWLQTYLQSAAGEHILPIQINPGKESKYEFSNSDESSTSSKSLNILDTK